MKNIDSRVKKLEGLNTVETVMKKLDIKRGTALNYLSELRKKGYLSYFSGGRKKRIYKITPFKTRFKGEEGLYEFINKHSKIKVREPYKHVLHGKKMTSEKAIVLALQEQNFRLILASLNLFNHVKDWSQLNEYARKYRLQMQVGALYDIARLFIRTRKIDERTRKSMLKSKGKTYIYDKIKTKDFKEIAGTWKVEIPFTKKDVLRLKTG